MFDYISNITIKDSQTVHFHDKRGSSFCHRIFMKIIRRGMDLVSAGALHGILLLTDYLHLQPLLRGVRERPLKYRVSLFFKSWFWQNYTYFEKKSKFLQCFFFRIWDFLSQNCPYLGKCPNFEKEKKKACILNKIEN